MTQIIFNEDAKTGGGSGMIGNPSFLGSSDSNNYDGSFLGFNDNYIYDSYPQEFGGTPTVNHQSLALATQPNIFLQYPELQSSQFKPTVFDVSPFCPESLGLDQAQHKNCDNVTPPRREKAQIPETSRSSLVPPCATPAEPPTQDTFCSLPSNGFGSFVGNWPNYENSAGTLPLSMMHSPLRATQQMAQFEMIPLSESDNALSNQGPFFPQSLAFPSHLYPQPEMEHSTMAINDPSHLMRFYAEISPDPALGTSGHPHSLQVNPLNRSTVTSSPAIESRKRKRDGNTTTGGPCQKLMSKIETMPNSAKTSNRATARSTKGQIMVLKDSGDLIAEPDDQDSSYQRSTVPRRYMCSVCSKRFTRPSTLRTHMNSHTGERPYHCPSKGCDWKFTVLSNLKRHMRICSGPKDGGDATGIESTKPEIKDEAADADWKP
ncbi:hypothetical protein HDU84_007741 [Entophlyctis sp. JEL0112]|nr:hypothetical protein HDU84_007741 [Entophlyctis sp. JEL0112]